MFNSLNNELNNSLNICPTSFLVHKENISLNYVLKKYDRIYCSLKAIAFKAISAFKECDVIVKYEASKGFYLCHI